MNEGTRGGGARGSEEGGRIKIGKESRLSPVINGGIPVWRGGWRGSVRERPGFIEKKHSVFGMKRKQTIIYID